VVSFHVPALSSALTTIAMRSSRTLRDEPVSTPAHVPTRAPPESAGAAPAASGLAAYPAATVTPISKNAIARASDLEVLDPRVIRAGDDVKSMRSPSASFGLHL
jgi:hypothetical protein